MFRGLTSSLRFCSTRPLAEVKPATCRARRLRFCARDSPHFHVRAQPMYEINRPPVQLATASRGLRPTRAQPHRQYTHPRTNPARTAGALDTKQSMSFLRQKRHAHQNSQ